ncbi:MAG: TnpV protein [Clostridia bacterium]|nr:TnpV protein [Clostridia bacterium]
MRKEITYTEKDGYLYPDLKLPEQEDVAIGRWGQKHKRFLKKFSKLTYFHLLTSGKLTAYLAEVDRQAQDMFETIVNQSMEVHGITEELKAENPMEWVRQMNSIMNMAEEFVLQELVYV